MNRLNNLSDNVIIRRIDDLKRQQEEIHRAQRMGRGSVTPHRVFSGNAYDFEITNVQDYDTRVMELTFTPDDTSGDLGGVFEMLWEIVGGGGVMTTEEPLVPDNGLSKWRFYFQRSPFVPPNPSAQYKFWFWSNANGTFTANLI